MEALQRGSERTVESGFTWVQDFCALPPKQSWLIRGYLEPDTLCVLYGDSQAYKSFLAIDWAGHFATGKEWRGCKTKFGIVIYIAGEGGNGLSKRFKAWFQYHNEPMRNIAISTVPRALCDPANVDNLIVRIKTLMAATPGTILMIVLDTLGTHFGGGNQNETADMLKFINAIRQLRIATGATILVVHHVGHADKKRTKGAIDLPQGVDWIYRLERSPESETTTLINDKPRDAETPPPLSWNLEVVPLPWADEDGEPLNSCVLVPNDSIPTAQPVKEKSLTGLPKKALDVLQGQYRHQRETLVKGGQDTRQARVTISQWSDAMQSLHEDKDYRSTVRRDLEKRGYVRFEAPYVYLAGQVE